MQKVIRTNSADPKFIELVKQLDAYLAIQNGEENDFYAQYNKIDIIKHAIVIEFNSEPVACGAIKEVMPGAMEIKRMYTNPTLRNQGLGTQVLSALEEWAKELGYQKCMLETGKFLPDAVALYQKNDYQIIPNYGQYVGVETSVCFEKIIK